MKKSVSKFMPAKVLLVKTSHARARVAKSAGSENNTCTCTCRICNLIGAEEATFQCENVLLCYKCNGQCLACVHPIRDALGQLGEHLGSQRCSRLRHEHLLRYLRARLRLEHLLRYIRALPTIRVHPELDGRTLDIVHSFKKPQAKIRLAFHFVESTN